MRTYTIFIFDTNVLLNLYNYEDRTKEDFFEVLKRIESQVWLPHHVGLEYQRRRLEVIRDAKKTFSDIKKHIDSINDKFSTGFDKFSLEKKHPSLHTETIKLKQKAEKLLAAYTAKVEENDEIQPCVSSHDSIREKVSAIFFNKVGSQPENQGWLDAIYAEGEERYKEKIAPGFMDAEKSQRQDSSFKFNDLNYKREYGDLILWKQIIEKCKEEKIKNVIFVTDDAKEDWWYTLQSRGKKRIGPHANLKEEIYREADINFFYMYNTSHFLTDGKESLSIRINESSIDETRIQFWESLKRRELSEKNKNKTKIISEKEILPPHFYIEEMIKNQLSIDKTIEEENQREMTINQTMSEYEKRQQMQYLASEYLKKLALKYHKKRKQPDNIEQVENSHKSDAPFFSYDDET